MSIQLTMPPNEPDDSDPLKGLSESAAQLIKSHTRLMDDLEGEAVLLLDGPWGSGKTTLVKAWEKYIKKEKGWKTIYIDAFQYDFNSDPLIMIGQEIMAGIPDAKSRRKLKQALIEYLKMTPHLIRYIPITGEIAGKMSELIVEKYLGEETMEKRIKNIRKDLEDITKGGKIIIFIDELDRCRPTYAIETLEKVKHLFSVNKIVFVLVANVSQLGKNLNHLYGGNQDRDVWEYLQKLIGYVISMPPDKKSDWDESYIGTLTELCPDEEQYKSTISGFNLLLDRYKVKSEDKTSTSNFTYRQMQKFYLGVSLLLHDNTICDCGYAPILFYLREFYRPLYENIKNGEYDTDKDDVSILTDLIESVPSKVDQSPQSESLTVYIYNHLSSIEKMILSFMQCLFEQEFQKVSIRNIGNHEVERQTAKELMKIATVEVQRGGDIKTSFSLYEPLPLPDRRKLISKLCQRIDSTALR